MSAVYTFTYVPTGEPGVAAYRVFYGVGTPGTDGYTSSEGDTPADGTTNPMTTNELFLKEGQPVHVSVKAVNASGEGPEATADFTSATQPPPPPPPAPTQAPTGLTVNFVRFEPNP